MFSHLFRKRSIYCPTWKLSLVLLVFLVGVTVVTLKFLYPFLARSEAVEEFDVMVIDGWVSDQTVESAVAMARERSCETILSAGVELPNGYHLSSYKTFAHVGEATLEALGVPEDQAHAAPGGADHRHRTFASAVAVYRWLEKEDRLNDRVLVVTEGAHGRRSLAVYRKVFEEKNKIGIISKPPLSYDPDRWWTSSGGVKAVIVETIAVLDEWLRDSGRSSNDPDSVSA